MINNYPKTKIEALSKINQRNKGLNRNEKVIQERESINEEQFEEEDNKHNGRDGGIGVIDEVKRKLNIKMDFNPINNPKEEEIITIFLSKIVQLLQRWINNRKILGVYDKEGEPIFNNLNQLQD